MIPYHKISSQLLNRLLCRSFKVVVGLISFHTKPKKMIWKSPKVGTALQTERHSTLHHPTAYKSDRDLMWESHNHHIDKKQIRCFYRGMICSWLLRYMSNFFAYYASPTSQRKCKCDDRFIVWRYNALCDPKSILNYCTATRNIYMPWSKFSSKPKETKKFSVFVMYSLAVQNIEKQSIPSE